VKLFSLFAALFLLPAVCLAAGNETFMSFNKSKKTLLSQVYSDHHETFYCDSDFDEKKQVFHTRGYIPVKNNKRAKRIEWEHIVPAHAFGQSFKEWREGDVQCVSSKGKPFKGRRCVEKLNYEYRYMQADMHNLVPAIGEVNGLRSNYSFTMIPGEERRFGACDMEISNQKAEPPEDVRGDIARTYFYMDNAYPGRGIISNKNRKLFEAWDSLDPVDEWECERERRIANIQGNENRYVRSKCSETPSVEIAVQSND
jgi:deoxyribonuclease-1